MSKKAVAIFVISVLAIVGVIAFLIVPSVKKHAQNSQTVTLNIPKTSLDQVQSKGAIEVSLRSKDASRIARVEYLLDGKVSAKSIEPPFRVLITISHLKPGKHTIQAVAYDFSGGTTKTKVFTFTINDNNSVSPADDESQQIVDESISFDEQQAGSSQSGNRSSSSPPSTTANTSNGSSGNTGNGNQDNGNTTPMATRTAGGWWASLPSTMQVCSNAVWNGGPTTAPAGSITVPAGNNAGFDFSQTSKTYWFAPGEHTLGPGQFAQIEPGSNSTYIGAPGAVLDGKNNNQYAFSGSASNVRIAYLEVRNFGRGLDNNNEGVINHDSGTGWTMEYLYAHNNDGAAVFVGSQNTVQYNCLKDNGQYGFSMYKDQVPGDFAIKNIVLNNNEISGNNQDDWETQINGCGCTGGGKFWDVLGARVTNNYVHDNLSTGLWADTNDTDFLFDSNWIEHNSGEGIWYEISYNATISRNVIKRNAWATGNGNLGSPAPAIYISESGGDSRLPSTVSGSTDLQIKHNLLDNNFSGISIFENSNRFCNSNGNTSKTYCTPFVTPTIIAAPYNYIYPNPINSTHPCYTNVGSAPYTTNCRWNSQNVQVFENEFRFDDAVVPCAGTYCGVHALFATGDDNISWAPAAYNIATVQNRVMFGANNKFFNNTYIGNWRFAKGYGEKIYFNEWRSTPFSQDTGSTFDGALTPPPVANVLDTDTATIEGSVGAWDTWFSTNIARSALQAHSGSRSLEVTLTSGGSWGLQLSNYPGFAATSGAKHASFWAKQGSGAIGNVTLRLRWFDGSSTLLQTDTVTLSSLSTSWQQGTASLTAPTGTQSVFLEVTSSSGSTGNTLYLDDFVVGDGS